MPPCHMAARPVLMYPPCTSSARRPLRLDPPHQSASWRFACPLSQPLCFQARRVPLFGASRTDSIALDRPCDLSSAHKALGGLRSTVQAAFPGGCSTAHGPWRRPVPSCVARPRELLLGRASGTIRHPAGWSVRPWQVGRHLKGAALVSALHASLASCMCHLLASCVTFQCLCCTHA